MGFLLEEAGEIKGKDGRRVSVVDPINGAHQLHSRHSALCRLHWPDPNGGPVAGLVYNPITDELFAAERGGGALSQRPAYPGGGAARHP